MGFPGLNADSEEINGLSGRGEGDARIGQNHDAQDDQDDGDCH